MVTHHQIKVLSVTPATATTWFRTATKLLDGLAAGLHRAGGTLAVSPPFIEIDKLLNFIW